MNVLSKLCLMLGAAAAVLHVRTDYELYRLENEPVHANEDLYLHIGGKIAHIQRNE